MIRCLADSYRRSTGWLATGLGPPVLLLLRIWVALASWRAGVVKIEDPASTQYPFASMYHVPRLPPAIAAMLATWIELVVRWFVGLGLFGRLAALIARLIRAWRPRRHHASLAPGA